MTDTNKQIVDELGMVLSQVIEDIIKSAFRIDDKTFEGADVFYSSVDLKGKNFDINAIVAGVHNLPILKMLFTKAEYSISYIYTDKEQGPKMVLMVYPLVTEHPDYKE